MATYCSQCGAPLDPVTGDCPNCGPLSGENVRQQIRNPAPQAQRQMGDRTKNILLAAMAAALLLCGIAICVLLFGKFGNKNITVPPAPQLSEPDPAPQSSETQLPAVGEVVQFGAYPQFGSRTPIEWKVLDTFGDSVLLISKYSLDCVPYHTLPENTDWENCSLRTWLNDAFLNSAFSEAEQKRILTSVSRADKNPMFDTEPGTDTEDRVFLLSCREVLKYFPEMDDRLCYPTDYAVEKGGYKNSDTSGCWWWLRSPGRNGEYAGSVNSDGQIDFADGRVNSNRGTVRPAIWVNYN